MTPFEKDLEKVVNCNSMESGSNLPDFIIAKYLSECLKALEAFIERTKQNVYLTEQSIWKFTLECVRAKDKAINAGKKWHSPEGLSEEFLQEGGYK